jgi:hypothetical protein
MNPVSHVNCFSLPRVCSGEILGIKQKMTEIENRLKEISCNQYLGGSKSAYSQSEISSLKGRLNHYRSKINKLESTSASSPVQFSLVNPEDLLRKKVDEMREDIQKSKPKLANLCISKPVEVNQRIQAAIVRTEDELCDQIFWKQDAKDQKMYLEQCPTKDLLERGKYLRLGFLKVARGEAFIGKVGASSKKAELDLINEILRKRQEKYKSEKKAEF